MIVGPPIPWALVPIGAIALHNGTPRKVEHADDRLYHGRRVLFLEGLTAPLLVEPGHHTQLVTIGPADAIATLDAAGLDPQEIS